MKFYESHYEEYLESMNKYNLHPELSGKIHNIGNLIVYGPPGVGKYTQVLSILKPYSGTGLKYDKKITIQTDKQDYTYHISDVHYEIDMSLLGCNSKILWREIFSQIVDIVSVKAEKIGFIVCTNFQSIHAELLEVFYSYIQQYSHHKSTIRIHFIIITEHISFLPNNIIKSCQILNVRRPSKSQYLKLSSVTVDNNMSIEYFTRKINTEYKPGSCSVTSEIFDQIQAKEIVNCKEIKSFASIKDGKLPKDIFNMVCDNIIAEIISTGKLSYSNFRDVIYDMLIYNLDVTECIWYILCFLEQNGMIRGSDLSDVLDKCYVFLRYYNNNYRPIYHLESILLYFVVKIQNGRESRTRAT